MALISCPDCGRQVSSDAKACPDCACPVAERIKDADAGPGGAAFAFDVVTGPFGCGCFPAVLVLLGLTGLAALA